MNRAFRWVALRECRKHGPSAPKPQDDQPGVRFVQHSRFLPGAHGAHFDWLSRDESVVDAYLADPLCGFPCSGQLWADLFAGISEIEKAEDDPSRPCCTLPLLLIVGSQDPVSMGGLGHAQLAKRATAPPATRASRTGATPEGGTRC